jgi:hypothetical protein
MWNLQMTPRVVLHSLVRLKAYKTWSCATPWIQGKEKICDQDQLNNECVEDLVHRDAWLQFISQGKGWKGIKSQSKTVVK